MVAAMIELWCQIAARAQVPLTERQEALLNQYLDLLLEANQRMNLTGISDRAQAEVQHIGDTLTLLPFLAPGPIRLADVGSGGGVPGIPLAIVRPDAEVLLIESTKKKAAFLRSVVEQLALGNVTVSDQRVEDLAQDPTHRESFDIAVARAVATIDWLIEWCLPLVKKGGKFLAMKGPKVHEELPRASKTLKQAGGGAPAIHPVDLPGAEHHLIVEISKIARSDSRLPRLPSIAKGRPLGL
jgi:16S rRNA (guanine527-N7)-methyltransferase